MTSCSSILAGLVLVVLYPVMSAGYEVSFTTTDVCVVESGGAVTVSVVRAGTGSGASSVWLATLPVTAFPGSDYVPATGWIQFEAGQSTVQQVIPVVYDTTPDPSRMFHVLLQSFSNCVPGAVLTNVVVIQDAQAIEAVASDFGSGLPGGWLVTTNADTNCCWRFDNPGGRPNYTGGSGGMAIADSDAAGTFDMDTELRSPSFAGTAGRTYLVFKTDYYVGSYDIADVDVSVNGGDGPWVNLWRKQFYDYSGPVTEFIELTPEVEGHSNAMVRFHYYNAYWDGYWQIDDVALLVEPDSNSNSLPDWWETAYYSCVTNLDPLCDSDGDGACNMNEFIAGTHPVETGSCFMVRGLVWSNQTVNINFPTEIGHFYDLLSCPDLMNEPWSNQVYRIPGTGSPTNISLPDQGAGGFHRTKLTRW